MGGAQYGGGWNRRVCAGSLENLDLRKLKVQTSPEKITEGWSRSRVDRCKLWADVESVYGLEFWELKN